MYLGSSRNEGTIYCSSLTTLTDLQMGLMEFSSHIDRRTSHLSLLMPSTWISVDVNRDKGTPTPTPMPIPTLMPMPTLMPTTTPMTTPTMTQVLNRKLLQWPLARRSGASSHQRRLPQCRRGSTQRNSSKPLITPRIWCTYTSSSLTCSPSMIHSSRSSTSICWKASPMLKGSLKSLSLMVCWHILFLSSAEAAVRMVG